MRIRIAAAGSRGDIAPHTGLGAGLREAGHEGRPRLMGTRSLGRLGNRTAGGLALRMADRVYTEAVTELRRRLDLPSLAAAEMRGATGARELARPARLQHGTGAAPVGLARGTRHRRRLVAVPRSGPSTPR